MNAPFTDFSGRIHLEVTEYAQPRTLAELVASVQAAETKGLPAHAMGTGWAFSAPAYCPGTVIRTNRLRGFPPAVQDAIVDPQPDERTVLVAVEAGITIRDLYLSLTENTTYLPALRVTVNPVEPELNEFTTLIVTVRDDHGIPVAGADVRITNYPANRLVLKTDGSGIASTTIRFRAERVFDPGTRTWETGRYPTAEVAAVGFTTTAVPLAFEPGAVITPDPNAAPWALPSGLARGRDLQLKTMGGVGAQTLAGATSTGTHGADVARPPIGDYIRALVVVGSGGRVRLLQRDDIAPVVDFTALRENLSSQIDASLISDGTSTETFDAALLAVGRFGVIYACVLEVEDDSADFVYHRRSVTNWSDVKANLPAMIENARTTDRFLQVVINPVRPPDGNRRCYVTEGAKLPRDVVDNAGAAFPTDALGNPALLWASHPVVVVTDFAGPFGHADLTALAGAPNAAGDPVVVVTDFPGQGPCLRVMYRGTDGRIHEIATTAPATGPFGHADLTALAGAPNAAGDPVVAVTDFPGQGPCLRVAYRGTDGRIHEIATTAPATGPFGHADLTALAGAPNAAGDPVVAVTDFPGQGPCLRVAYRGTDGRIHEIATTAPATGPFGHADLTALAGAPNAAGDPVVAVTDFPSQGPCLRVAYRGTDGRIHEIATTAPATGPFGHADLTALAGAPNAAGDPVVAVTDFPGQGPCLRVAYRGTDGRIHEIATTAPASGPFGHADLTALAGAPNAAGDPVVAVTDFPSQAPCLRVMYRGTDGRIHEIATTAPATGPFGHADLTALAGAPNATGDPVVAVTDFPSQAPCLRVMYRGTDGRIHEIASTGPFGHADLTALAGAANAGISQLASTPIRDARRQPLPPIPLPNEWRGVAAVADAFAGLTGPADRNAAPSGGTVTFCASSLTAEMQHHLTVLRNLATHLVGLLPGGEMIPAAIDSLVRISSTHNIGDVVADTLNSGPPEIVDQIISGVVDTALRPWLVHGRRWEVSDNYDYQNDCYRGDSVELFFAADDTLPANVERVLTVFDQLRAMNRPIAGWISLRFMAPSRALLGMSMFEPVTCAIEMAMLRGMKANDLALLELQNIARKHNGRIHWGQRNDLNGSEIGEMFGSRYQRWCRQLEAVEGSSPTFSNPFSADHGLEPFLIPAPKPRLMLVTVEPAVLELHVPVAVTFSCIDEQTSAPVAATVTVTNFRASQVEVGEYPANVLHQFTFDTGPIEFDLATRESSKEYPSATVKAPGYKDVSVTLPFLL